MRKPHADLLTTEFVHRLVAGQFPEWAHLPIGPADVQGWDNITFRLGTELSVRLPSGPSYAPQVEKEQVWLPRLASVLSVQIPEPLAMGVASEEFPFAWSVYKWIEGESAQSQRIDDLTVFAEAVAAFLVELQGLGLEGPAPGQHSSFRGCSVTFDDPARPHKTPGNWAVHDSIAMLDGRTDRELAIEVWDAAVDAGEPAAPTWVHGDVAADNLLVRDGRLAAVIDWGCSAFGDAACDLGIAWTLFSGESREVFRDRLGADERVWARARGWALWVPLYRLAQTVAQPSAEGRELFGRVVDEILEDHVRFG